MKVLVTRRIPEPGLKILESAGLEVDLWEFDSPIPREELIKRIKGKDALLSQLVDKIDSEVINAGLPTLKVVSNYAVGYDNIDIEYCRDKGIIVTNTPGVLTEATAELALALIFAVMRRVVEADNFLRAGNWKGWSPTLLLGFDIHGKTLGVIGAGRIGQSLAIKAYHLGMNILYYSRTPKPELEAKTNAKKVDLPTLLKNSDVVSIHTPLTKETYHLIGEREISMMKSTAILINTARGPVVDEQALIKALQERKIWGAGLDVFEQEPYVPQDLIRLNNVVLLPHLGSATLETRSNMAKLAAENIVLALKGQEPKARVV